MSHPYLDKLKELNGQTRPIKVAERGALRTQLGFVEAGLSDLLAAAEAQPDSYWIEMQLAEAHRAYVRDIMLSTQERLRFVYSYLQTECVSRFERALALATKAAAPPRTLAWIHAHTGATLTLVYFVMQSSGARRKDMPALFEQAMQSFADALAAEPNYPWCIHLQAYLRTLRGEPGDFEAARLLLTQAMELGAMTGAALDRNLAMLHSYEAAALGDDPKLSPQLDLGVEAANDSIQKGLDVMRQDPDDQVAAYTVAASLGWLVLKAGQDDCKDHLRAAVSTAKTRAQNALARTYATLAGLALLEKEIGSNPAAEETAWEIFVQRFAKGDPAPDVETWALLNRDPIWRSHPLYRDLLQLLSQGLDAEAQAAQ